MVSRVTVVNRDVNNSRVVDILRELVEYGVDLSIWDPVVDPDEVHHEYGNTVITEPEKMCL